jgi:hypothetical protein
MATDRAVEANKPDIVVIDQGNLKGLIIDIAVPLDDNLEKTHAEKRRKYQGLAVELKDIYKLEKVEIIPIVGSTNGLVLKDWKQLTKKLSLTDKHLRLMQKAAVLGTANVVRKVLSLSDIRLIDNNVARLVSCHLFMTDACCNTLFKNK